MLKRIILITFFITTLTAVSFAQTGSYAGAFARMGFGAKGLAMGNAMVSNSFGDVSSYYNPALSCFQVQGFANLGYTFLSLDRKLNFVSFSKKFNLQSNKKGGAGISLSWINAGVNNIDGRDNDTRQLGDLSTFENQFALGTSFLIDENFSLGVAFKLYYAKLYDKVTTNSVAFDIGAVYKLYPNLSFGLALKDISARYKWETSKIYGSSGTTTENKFPVLLNLGSTYLLPKNFGTVSLELESYINPKLETKDETGVVINSDRKINYYLKAGGEIKVSNNLYLRAGIERIEFGSEDFWGNIKPGFGIGFYRNFTKGIILGIDYSFQLEPYSHEPVQNLGIGFKFN